jgi:hypothetical protein
MAILLPAFIGPAPAKSLGHKSSLLTERKKETRASCPQRSFQIAKRALEDVAEFKIKRPSSSWPAFVVDAKKKYKSCSAYVQKMYLRAAGQAFAGRRQTLLPER